MIFSRPKNILFGVMILAISQVICNATELEAQARNICIAAAKDELDILRLSDKLLESHCNCVGKQSGGKMPKTKLEWKSGGRNSAKFKLTECAKNEIISFYSTPEFKWQMERLKKQGFENNSFAIKRAKDFSFCVGEASYNEVLRVAENIDQKNSKFDKTRYLRTYLLCEAV